MSKTYSLLRRGQYKELSRLSIDGKILDLGGTHESAYHGLIGGSHTIDTANIKNANLIFDAEKKFPIEDESYDAIICLNVLEHLFEYQNAVNESYRVLKEGGIMVGSTPFMHQVHGSPDDYFRYTRSAFEKIFAKAGFKEVEIKELGTGVFSVVFEKMSGPIRPQFLKEVFKYITILDKVHRFLKESNQFTEKYMPLGYFFTVHK